MEKQNKRSVGTAYEAAAAEYLISRNYQILEKNYRCRQGEIDLIALDGRYLVFIEVKYRSSLRCGTPEAAVDYRKQAKLRSVARLYLYSHGYGEDAPCRFDVVAVLGGGQIQLYQNAF